MTTQRIPVSSSAGAYKVAYGQGLLAKAAAEIDSLGPHTGVYLLTSPRVNRHWGAKIAKAFTRPRALTGKIIFDDRESCKNLATVESICRHLTRAGADRRAILIAVGGGVVGDVAGFAAASYLRGVRLIHVPTTLVAQVDSALGGKTGVNLPEGKNLVGAFYPPKLVLADPDTLATLPAREFRSGLYEVVKYGVIGDAKLFAYLEKSHAAKIQTNRDALDFIIPRCIRAKARVVSRDERESGLREILNFGHTFAHALETATAYRRYLHGEAVGWGMIAAARLSATRGMLPPAQARRIEALVRSIGPLPALPETTPQRLIAIMHSDKKTQAGQLRFVLTSGIGSAQTVSGVPLAEVRQILAKLNTQS